MNIETIRFTTDDGLWLGGLLYKPTEKTDTVIISIHGAQSALIRQRETIFGNQTANGGFAYFAFNNRSTAILERFNRTLEDGKIIRVLYGSANDNLEESYYDINSSVNLMIEKGYNNIVLLGHCLSCAKILNYLNKSNNPNVKSIILLSPSDCINYQKQRIGNNFDKDLQYAKDNISKLELMANWELEITPKTYYDYFKNDSINNLTNYKNDFLSKWRCIPDKVFISFCGINEVITVEPNLVFEQVKKYFSNKKIRTKLYENTTHSYAKHEEKLIQDVIEFLRED